MPSYVQGRRHRRIDDSEIIKLYVEDGIDAETIGIRAACCGSTVLALVRAAGHPVRKPGRGAPRARKLSNEDIIQRYRDGQAGPAIADAAGCTAATVYNILRKAGQPIRSSACVAKGTPRNG